MSTFEVVVRETDSSEETEEFGVEFSKEIRIGDNIILKGELGSGKTTFVKGVVKGLGITVNITSPSFTIINLYKSESRTTNHEIVVAHIDLYRIEKKDLSGLGIDEFFLKDYITLIEYGDKLDKEIIESYKFRTISFEHLGGDGRRIKLE
ncbi:MAG: tRNA (adenosine(37)-N6)-threonylcarbamoyltransferase complex ATPase subunit type 1 TsaE [Candidatus Hydrogenedentota bacterium]